ncbi:MAG: TfoX/Sxy family protein [Desulfobacteraceae bacterium]|jgi:DNA transformation protein
MANGNEFITHLLELLEPLGSVEAKSMFGGFGIYRQGFMFGLVSEDTLYLKADEVNRGEFEGKGLPRFTYQRMGKMLSMSYYQVPHEAMDNPEVLCGWAQKAYEAAVRGAQKKSKKKRGKK